MKVLNERHSPLSFRVQPLLLRLDTTTLVGDDDGDGGGGHQTKTGGYGEGANFMLVARREVLVISSPSPSQMSATAAAAGGRGGGGGGVNTTSQQQRNLAPGATASSAGGSCREGGQSVDLSNPEGPTRRIANLLQKEETIMRIAEVEELGRSPPFPIRSATTVPPGSFAIPANALVADARRKGDNRGETAKPAALGGAGGEARRSGPVVRIVLELVHAAGTGGIGGGGERGPSFFGRTKQSTTMWSKTSEEGPGPPVDGVAGGDALGGTVARAILDAAFLRRTIGCQRSIMMMTAPSPSGEGIAGGGEEGGGGGGSPSPETAEGSTKQEDLPQCFGRLELAGHAVRARPGKPRLRLQVLGCQNLRSADLFGKSDPCVLVFWGGVEVGRTSIARDNLNPAFSSPENMFQLPLIPPSAAAAQQRFSNRAAGRQRRSSTRRSQDWSEYAPTLRLEVWDMDRDTFSRKWGKGELLGVVSLCGPCGIVPVIEASTAQVLGLDPATAGAAAVAGTPVDAAGAGVMLKLSAGGCVGKKESASHAPAPSQVSAGIISIKVAVENATDDSETWVARAGASSLAAAASAVPGPFQPMQDKSVAAVQASVHSEKKTLSTLSLGNLTVSNPVYLPPQARVWLPQPRLRVRCLDARRLPLGCDGYCRMFWNGRQVGQTSLASTIARDIHGLANNNSKNPGPVASSFQRNPVWCTPLTASLTVDRSNSSNSNLQSRSRSRGAAEAAATSAAAIVPLYEEPAGDRLTLEVFDGSHFRDKASNGGEQESPAHDGLGRSLGSVTIFGERLVSPPRRRVDLELSPSLPGDKSAAVISLSVSLERLSSEEDEQEEGAEEHLTNGFHAISPREASENPRDNTSASIRGTSTNTRETGASPQQKGASSRETIATKRQEHDNDNAAPISTTATTTVTTTTTTTSSFSEPATKENNNNNYLHRNQGGRSRQHPKLWLRLLLEGSRLLHGMDLSGTSDPYCQVYLDRVWHSKTGVCWGTLTPRWNQTFEIEISGRGSSSSLVAGLGWDHEIRVELWDKDVVGADDFIGESNLFLHRRRDG